MIKSSLILCAFVNADRGMHAAPSSLLQVNEASANLRTHRGYSDPIIEALRKQVDQFNQKMTAEANDDKAMIRKLGEQQRQYNRDMSAFEAKYLHPHDSSSLIQTRDSPHVEDPVIDDAMKTFHDELESEASDMKRFISAAKETNIVNEDSSSSFAESPVDLKTISKALEIRQQQFHQHK
jgi:hypothetical protein